MSAQGRIPAEVRNILERSRRLGFLGPGPVEAHIGHALSMVDICGHQRSARALDLGAGGGVPGLVLAALRPSWSIVLLDSNRRRTDFLSEITGSLRWAHVEVCTMRAEAAGRHADLRGTFDIVISRSFGSPAVTAECAAPLLRLGGRAVVSESPEAFLDDRWPAAGLAQLGLRRWPLPPPAAAVSLVVLDQNGECPDRYPRRIGIPAKRPLWNVSRETSPPEPGRSTSRP